MILPLFASLTGRRQCARLRPRWQHSRRRLACGFAFFPFAVWQLQPISWPPGWQEWSKCWQEYRFVLWQHSPAFRDHQNCQAHGNNDSPACQCFENECPLKHYLPISHLTWLPKVKAFQYFNMSSSILIVYIHWYQMSDKHKYFIPRILGLQNAKKVVWNPWKNC